MKEYFDKNQYRLSDSEKAEVWQRISLASPKRRTTRRFWLAPTLGVVALAVCCFVFLYFSMPYEADLGYRRWSPNVSQHAPAPAEIQTDTREPQGKKDSSFKAAGEEPTAQEILPQRQRGPQVQNEDVATGAVRDEQGQPQDGITGKGTEKRAGADHADAQTAAALDVLSEGEAVTLPDEDEQLTAAVTPESTRVALQPGGAEAVADGLAGQPKIAVRDGELRVRGERSGEIAPELDTAARMQPAATVGVETPALAIPAEVATFPLVADTTSYVRCLQSLASGQLPAADLIRVDAFVNSLDQGYAAVLSGELTIQVDGATSPFRPDRILLRIGITGRDEAARAESPPAVTGNDSFPALLARRAEVQVSFDRDQITGYRWLGSTSSRPAPEDTAPDKSGRAEKYQPDQPFSIASTVTPPAGRAGYDLWEGHSIVALYEIARAPDVAGAPTLPDPGAARHDPSTTILARIHLDYERSGTGGAPAPASLTQIVSAADVSHSFEAAPPRFQLAAITAEFAEVLQGRVASPVVRLAQLRQMLNDLAPALPGSSELAELLTAVRRAEALFATESLPED